MYLIKSESRLLNPGCVIKYDLSVIKSCRLLTHFRRCEIFTARVFDLLRLNVRNKARRNRVRLAPFAELTLSQIFARLAI